MTTYRLIFLRDAKKEWDKLGGNVRNQLKKKIVERLSEPRIASARLHGMPDCYKIKLRRLGYRLVYRVDDGRVVVIVIAVGRRDHDEVYKAAARRMPD